MTTSVLQKVENIAVLGLLAGGLYVAWRFLKGSGTIPGGKEGEEHPCDEYAGLPWVFCQIGAFTLGHKPAEPEPVRDYDSHGCLKGVTEWCETLSHCQPVGLTCPRPAKPYVPVYSYDEHDCKIGIERYCEVLGQCLNNEVFSDNFCTVHDDTEPDPSPIRQIGDRCYYGDKVLNVPPGKDCKTAIDDMCRRFGPDSGWCG